MSHLLQEAMSSDYAKEWQEAIDTELAGMWEKGVFSDVPIPPDRKPVGTKYVLKIKRNADGTIERFKADLLHKDSVNSKELTMVKHSAL